MKNIIKALAIILFLASTHGAWAQAKPTTEKDKINEVINELFNAYRAGDSARVAATFDKKALIQTVREDASGKVILTEPVPATKLLAYIGSGLAEVHDERLWDTQVFMDKYMATVWTKYAFYLGKKFMHCGTEVFTLRKVEGSWKIFYLADTRQLKNCNVPAGIK